MAWWQPIQERLATPIEPSRLSFDLENPRYASEDGQPYETDEEIVRYLDETADLGELIQSISTSGFIDIEPLVVMGEDERLVVLEGNRRLAALKVLSDPDLASECDISFPAMSKQVRQTLEKVNVYRVADRKAARDFIGFKHINGAHRWDSIAKARYATAWFKEERAKGSGGLSLQDIARRMGDRHSTLQRMVAGLLTLEQATREQLFDPAERWGDRQFAFSHLYTALQRPGYRKYLGLSADAKQSAPEENPVPKEFLPRLKQVLLWLYGSRPDKIRPVIKSQNPDIKDLGEVLDSPRARAIMLETSDLGAAVSELVPPASQFEGAVVELHRKSKSAVSLVTAYKGGDEALTELVDETHRNVRLVLSQMRELDKEIGEPQK